MTTTIQRSFAHGEVAPEMRTKSELAAYSSGLKTARNIIVGKVGGIFNRPGTISVTKTSLIRASSAKILGRAKGYILVLAGIRYDRADNDPRLMLPPTGRGYSILTAYSLSDDTPLTPINTPYTVEDLGDISITSSEDDGLILYHESYAPLELNVDESGAEPVLTWRFNTSRAFVPSTMTSPIDTDPLTARVIGTEGSERAVYMFTETDTTGVESEILGKVSIDNASRFLNTANYVRLLIRVSDESNESRFFNVYKEMSGEWRLLAVLPYSAITEVMHEGPPVSTTHDVVIQDIGQALGESYSIANDQITPYVARPDEIRPESGEDLSTASLFSERFFYPFEETDNIRIPAFSDEFILFAVYDYEAPDGSQTLRTVRAEITSTEQIFFNRSRLAANYTPFFPDPVFSLMRLNIINERSAVFFRGNNPRLAIRYQDRQIFASTRFRPYALWLSRVGRAGDFGLGVQVTESSPFSFSVRSDEGGVIQSLLDLNGLYVFGSETVWRAFGNEAGVITPTQINLREVSNFGASSLPALKVGNVALIEQNGGGVIRSITPGSYSVEDSSTDVSLFSNHFLRDNRIVAWSFDKRPVPIVWMVRDDGTLLSFTYERSQEVLGWCRHDVVRDPGTSSFKVIDVRTIEGETYIACLAKGDIYEHDRIHVMRFDNRFKKDTPVFTDNTFIETAKEIDLADSAPAYKTTPTVDGVSEGISFASLSNNEFSEIFPHPIRPDESVDNYIFYELGGEFFADRIASVNYTNQTVTVERRVATTYSVPSDKLIIGVNVVRFGSESDFPGEEHFSYSIVGDGEVVASGVRRENAENFTVKLSRGYRRTEIGHPITSDIETLDIDLIGPTISQNFKKITEVNAYVDSTLGLYIGNSPPAQDGSVDGLALYRPNRRWESDGALDTSNGLVSINIDSTWNSSGSVFIRQVDPLPLAIFSIVPSGSIPSPGSGGAGG